MAMHHSCRCLTETQCLLMIAFWKPPDQESMIQKFLRTLSRYSRFKHPVNFTGMNTVLLIYILYVLNITPVLGVIGDYLHQAV